ncbi:unnamed protein product [Sphagnum compactum]
MKLELIPDVASGHYLHWLQLAELEKQEKSAQRMLCPTLDYYSGHSSSKVNNCATEKYTLLQEEKQKAAEEALSKGQDLSSRRKNQRDTELLLLKS